MLDVVHMLQSEEMEGEELSKRVDKFGHPVGQGRFILVVLTDRIVDCVLIHF